jgi:hypothetical protein
MNGMNEWRMVNEQGWLASKQQTGARNTDWQVGEGRSPLAPALRVDQYMHPQRIDKLCGSPHATSNRQLVVLAPAHAPLGFRIMHCITAPTPKIRKKFWLHAHLCSHAALTAPPPAPLLPPGNGRHTGVTAAGLCLDTTEASSRPTELPAMSPEM